ncbi:TlpA disulfide reductase family protein [Mucilaginibacter gynuensis]
MNIIKTTLLCSFMLLLELAASAQEKREKALVDSGNIFHFVDMRDINGNLIKPNELAGKTVVMNFWFIGCPPCVFELPMLSKIAEDYKDDKNKVFIAVSLDKPAELKEFLKKHPFAYHLIANGLPLANSYGIVTEPLNLVINKEGIIVFNSYGYGVASVPGRIEDVLKTL